MKNLIKYKLKQNIWLTGCLSLIFILCRPMMQLLEYENTQRYSVSMENTISVMEGFFLPDVFTDLTPTLLACAVIGLVYFSYLFSKKKVDLYHSIPINRKHIFLVNYISGIITYVIAILLEFILCVLIALPNHYMTATSFRNMFIAIVCNLIHFLYGYGIVILAVMLTGNIVVSVIATAVISLFHPIASTMLQYMQRYFFVTYTDCASLKPDFMTEYYWLSPIVSYATVVQRSNDDWDAFYFTKASSAYLSMIAPLIMAIVVTLAAYLLYLRRPSEAAGRPIAFKKSRPVIEIPIAVLGGLIGVWFMCVSVTKYKNAWIWAGALLGAILAHIIMEIVINESFKAFLSHKLQLLATIGIVVLIVGLYYGDLTKYDSFVPDRSKIKSAGIYFEGIDNNLSYSDIIPDEKNPGYYKTSYNMGQTYAFKNRMEGDLLIDKIYGISNIGTTCIEDMIATKEKENGDIAYYNEAKAVEEDYEYDDVSYEEKPDNLSDDELYEEALKWIEENGYHEVKQDDITRKINAEICYELTNGRLVFRRYEIPLSKVLASIGDVYNSEEFNRCHFDLYNGYEQGIINKVEVYDSYESRIISITGKDKDQFMEAFMKDLKAINIDTISQAPIGRIVPSYKASELYDESYSGYYIYPEYKNTLAFIKNFGADTSGLTTDVDASEIISINVNSYNLYSRNDQDYAYIPDVNYDSENDMDLIREIAPKLVNANNIWSNELLIDNKTNGDRSGVDIMVYITPKNGVQRSFSVRIKDGIVPERIKKDIAIKFYREN